MKSLMLMGTASNVGKSILCTAFCRIFTQDSYRTAPFKAQNMSLNSAATPTGKEIGRAQAVQAEACGIPPHEFMNPVLLKPSGRMNSQVVLRGQVHRQMSAADYFNEEKGELWEAVRQSYQELDKQADIVVIEGAGSPVEMNLKPRDLANMRTAEMADAAVLLTADIDRGGVFASVVGTLQLLSEQERKRVKGILINKFRGDLSFFHEGIELLEHLSGIPVVGVIPFMEDLSIDEEDAESLNNDRSGRYRRKKRPVSGQYGEPNELRIGIVRFPYLSNYTDIDPLFGENGVDAFFCDHPSEVAELDAIVLPGTKNTMEDTAWLMDSEWGERIKRAAEDGKHVLGICGGYQMMGSIIMDPLHIESEREEQAGLGLWDAVTTLQDRKRTVPVTGKLLPYGMRKRSGSVTGYEIHMGETRIRHGNSGPFLEIQNKQGSRAEGCVSSDGRRIGTYIHGILHNDSFRRAWLNEMRMARGWSELMEVAPYHKKRQEAYNQLAHHVRSHVDMQAVYAMLREAEELDK